MSLVFRLGAVALLHGDRSAGGVGCGGAASPPPFGPAGAGDDDDDGPEGTFGGGDVGRLHGHAAGRRGCATAIVGSQAAAVYLLFVLDGSGSMNQDNKWTAVVPALTVDLSQMAPRATRASVQGSSCSPTRTTRRPGAGPYPRAPTFPSPSSTRRIRRASTSALPGMPLGTWNADGRGADGRLWRARDLHGGSAAARRRQEGARSHHRRRADRRCNVVSSAVSSYATNACVVLAGNELKEAAPKGPIETFVIGVGDFSAGSFFGLGGIDPSFLGNLAQAGGTGQRVQPERDLEHERPLLLRDRPVEVARPRRSSSRSSRPRSTRFAGEVVSCTFPLQTNSRTTSTRRS